MTRQEEEDESTYGRRRAHVTTVKIVIFYFEEIKLMKEIFYNEVSSLILRFRVETVGSEVVMSRQERV